MKNFPWKNVLILIALIFACAFLARALTNSETIVDYVEKNQVIENEQVDWPAHLFYFYGLY